MPATSGEVLVCVCVSLAKDRLGKNHPDAGT